MKTYHLVIIGSGSAGLVIAVGAAKAGKKVLLIEKGNYGGDCTNFGCIPSKSLIASAEACYKIKTSTKFGLDLPTSLISGHRALSRVRQIVKEVRSHEDAQALSKLGIEILEGTATFSSSHILDVDGIKLFAEKIVIATGSSPFIPPIKGIKETPFLTNETIFSLTTIPKSMTVVGGGPIGCELAQAFQRLGTQISLIHSHEHLLNKEEKSAQTLIEEQFKNDGIHLYLDEAISNLEYKDNNFHIQTKKGFPLQTEQLLIAAGRRPNVSALQLDQAGIHYSEKGIVVDTYGRTNQHHIWAVGDVIGPPFFTHWAEHQARCVLTSLLLPMGLKKKINHHQPIPRVTFTSPEVASVGLSEEEASKKHSIACYVVPLSSIDRAITAGETEGFIKVITKKWSSQILGCTIAAPHAGEMISQITTAMLGKIPLRKLAKLIHPYPTYNHCIRKAADLWLTQTILSIFKK